MDKKNTRSITSFQDGKQVIEVEAKNTTKNCSNPNCNKKVNKELLDRTHKCKECRLEIIEA